MPAHLSLVDGIKFNVLEGAKDVPELANKVSLIAVVEVTKKGLDGLGSLVSLVERNATVLVSCHVAGHGV